MTLFWCFAIPTLATSPMWLLIYTSWKNQKATDEAIIARLKELY